MWNPQQYERFRDARRRPFFELLARVEHAGPREVVDLGCGTGDLTRVLAERWPDAQVLGVDGSEAMVERARAQALPGRLRFALGDLAAWAPATPRSVDVLVTNAALHWVPDHGPLLARLASHLAPGGVLALQVPANFEAPSHRLVEALKAEPRFAPALAGAPRGRVEPLAWYEARLAELGASVDAWDTTYLQVLPGEDAVLEWLLGTTLRPVLAALGESEGRVFVEALRPRLREAYPPTPRGTPFPFTRRFAVARFP
jgi:trans-aconitate 2-methyltransferase